MPGVNATCPVGVGHRNMTRSRKTSMTEPLRELVTGPAGSSSGSVQPWPYRWSGSTVRRRDESDLITAWGS